jgi:hypothetical protein
LAGGTTDAEPRDLLAEGGVAVTAAVGNLFLAAALDEDGAEGLVEALGVRSGLKEVATRHGVVHVGAPKCDSGERRFDSRGRAKRVRLVYRESVPRQRPTGSERSGGPSGDGDGDHQEERTR